VALLALLILFLAGPEPGDDIGTGGDVATDSAIAPEGAGTGTAPAAGEATPD
jgi:hypothetical protein